MGYASVMIPILLFVAITIRTVFSQDCAIHQFRCNNGYCIYRSSYCDGRQDCQDNSDETNCKKNPCPGAMLRCINPSTHFYNCIPESWKCDGRRDCLNMEDELNCKPIYKNDVEKVEGVLAAKTVLTQWFLQRRRNGSTTDRWGSQLHRTAVALFLANNTLLTPGNPLGEEISYELTIQLLHQRSKKKEIRSQDLALYINALLVSCVDPRDFYGDDLVSELRSCVDESNYTNPFEILTLCNAGDAMVAKDVERVTAAFDSKHRPFWTDTQAVASMALSCLSTRSPLLVDERTLMDMFRDLKRKQFRNGTVDNLKSTALVIQALLANKTYNADFDLESAVKVLLESRQEDGSFGSLLNAYHILPVLNYASLLNISDSHCTKTSESEDESMRKLLYSSEKEKIAVQYSVWIGTEVELSRTWKVKMHSNNSFYDVIERVRLLDSRHNAEYNVIDHKPFVSALMGLEDDTEMGLYWFTYTRSLLAEEEPRIVEQSPVDLKVKVNQEVILWYRAGEWGKNAILTSRSKD